jgi:archaellum component FlaC
MSADLNDVWNNVYMMRTNLLWGDSGQVQSGLVPQTLSKVTALAKVVDGTHELLAAVNEQTLGRIESLVLSLGTGISDKVDYLNGELAAVRTDLDAVSRDLVTLNTKIDELSATVEKDLSGMIELHAVVAQIRKDIANLPQKA